MQGSSVRQLAMVAVVVAAGAGLAGRAAGVIRPQVPLVNVLVESAALAFPAALVLVANLMRTRPVAATMEKVSSEGLRTTRAIVTAVTAAQAVVAFCVAALLVLRSWV